VSFLGSSGGVGRVGATLLRHRMIAATAGTAVAVIVAGCAFAATSGHENVKIEGEASPVAHTVTQKAKPAAAPPAKPLTLLSAAPSGGAKDANGGAPITLTFSSALAPATPLPKLSPAIAGRWKVSGATATFTPTSGFLPGTSVTVKVPGGTAGMTGAAASAGVLNKASTIRFTTGTYSTLRLQQILAQLGYLPLTWTPAATGSGSASIPAGAAASSSSPASLNAEVAAAYTPPAGSFSFQPGYPTELTSQWKTGADNMLDTGAIRAFEYNQNLTMDGTAGPEVWARLLAAAAGHKANPAGYTYALASQDSPHESLRVWHEGKLILNTAANTGISAAPTADGTFPVYERLQYQIMKGTNPDGSKYADPVYWISYFDGGDAVHYFERPGYGYYQSLGCVELPWTQAKFIWPYLTYGTLVTVQGPVA
jgi:peptidoglycan hydrolase-like protein with peptidoglycan-binding domain